MTAMGDREEKLVGSGPSQKWWAMYHRLRQYQMDNGNVSVAKSYVDNEGYAIGRWVDYQRQAKLSELKKQLLNQLDFVFRGKIKNENRWSSRYEELKQFKAKHGHCNVPSDYCQNKQLARWVKVQRRAYKNSGLHKDRIKALGELGFIWQIYKKRREPVAEADNNPTNPKKMRIANKSLPPTEDATPNQPRNDALKEQNKVLLAELAKLKNELEVKENELAEKQKQEIKLAEEKEEEMLKLIQKLKKMKAQRRTIELDKCRNPNQRTKWVDGGDFQTPNGSVGDIMPLRLLHDSNWFDRDIVEIPLKPELTDYVRNLIHDEETGFVPILKKQVWNNRRKVVNDIDCQNGWIIGNFKHKEKGRSDICYPMLLDLPKLESFWEGCLENGLKEAMKYLHQYLGISGKKIYMADCSCICVSKKTQQEGLHVDMKPECGNVGTLIIPIDLPSNKEKPEMLLEYKPPEDTSHGPNYSGKLISEHNSSSDVTMCCGYKYRIGTALFFKAGVYHNTNVFQTNSGRIMLCFHVGDWTDENLVELKKQSFKVAERLKKVTGTDYTIAKHNKKWKEKFSCEFDQ